MVAETGHLHPRPRGPPAVGRRRPERYPALTREVLDFLDARDGAGHVLRRRRDRRGAPRARHARSRRAATRSGSTAGGTAAHRARPPTPFRADVHAGQGAARGPHRRARCSGFRAPTFSLVPESRWAVDVLAETGFTYSSSVLPARSPLFGDPDAAAPRRSAGPTGWSSSRARWCAPAGVGLPYLGGVYLRAIPGAASTAARRSVGRDQLLWIYCHPYDFDPDEEFWVVPDAGRLGSRLLWYNRRRTFAKIEAMLRGRAGPPLAERLARGARRRPCLTPTSRSSRWCTGCRRRRSSTASTYLRDAARGPSRRARRLRRRGLPDAQRAVGRLAARAPRRAPPRAGGPRPRRRRASTTPARAATRRTRSTAATSTPCARSASRRPTSWSRAR